MSTLHSAIAEQWNVKWVTVECKMGPQWNVKWATVECKKWSHLQAAPPTLTLSYIYSHPFIELRPSNYFFCFSIALNASSIFKWYPAHSIIIANRTLGYSSLACTVLTYSPNRAQHSSSTLYSRLVTVVFIL